MGLIKTKSLKLEESFFGTALEWMFSGEARPTKMLNLTDILERMKMIGFTWPEETVFTTGTTVPEGTVGTQNNEARRDQLRKSFFSFLDYRTFFYLVGNWERFLGRRLVFRKETFLRLYLYRLEW